MRERFDLRREIAIIPVWAFVLAALIFVCVQVVFFAIMWTHTGLIPRILIPLLPGTILAFLVLMVGYVNRDAGRRGMSRTLWTLLVIFLYRTRSASFCTFCCGKLSRRNARNAERS